MEGKKELRTYIKTLLNEMSDNTYRTFSENISKNLQSLLLWKQANTIAITISRGREVDTKSIILKAWKENKKIVIPKCNPQTKEMVFHHIESFDQLEEVYFGLMEPKIAETAVVRPEEIDLLIVPGICFDSKGFRIGYGGGYYDRYLVNFTKPAISLAFSCQLVNHIPKEAHDIPVTKILTEHEVITCDV
ncbi:5-formyltetrahydrofolate cyclo-ligase [Metabacillus litoralis]|uniref:5-formyltetrahydrofolate cyclo-ligase n=1 Tax=Metabacillus litoralis TaxID=152268 RepID=UPI001CFD86F8|nr:5-formyltetrahydrofolate cyclo-ligase [Metabacillus litoralis]